MSVSKAIEAFAQLSGNVIIQPGTQLYEEITASYFSGLERDQRPACFFTPHSSAQVSEVVKAIKPFSDGLKVAICGSGQQATPAVANVRDGITIHLRNLRGVDVDKKNGVVSIAAGEQMGNVYEKLVSLGLGCVGNRHSSGGIGGDAVQGAF